MRVYLCGSMVGRIGAKVLGERWKATELLTDAGIEVFDPAKNEHVDPTKPIDIRVDFETMRAFVSKDEYAIRHCDVLLVLTGDEPSDGSWWEMGLAHFECKMPIVIVAPLRAAGEKMGFTNVKANAILPTVEEAVDFIATNYKGAH